MASEKDNNWRWVKREIHESNIVSKWNIFSNYFCSCQSVQLPLNALLPLIDGVTSTFIVKKRISFPYTNATTCRICTVFPLRWFEPLFGNILFKFSLLTCFLNAVSFLYKPIFNCSIKHLCKSTLRRRAVLSTSSTQARCSPNLLYAGALLS